MEALLDPDKTIDDHAAQHCDVLGGKVADYGLVKEDVSLWGEFIIPTPDYKGNRDTGQCLYGDGSIA